MEPSFYFYDLETSGISARSARIMQFAGQRTDMRLKPIGEPDNVLIQLTDDMLPEPDAILVTGITPQKTRAEGITEAAFLRQFHETIAVPGTIFVGYNSIRFDDEFMRFLHYRNFYDAYEWSWKEGRSRWDLLDVVRMTRALRPDGIEWPVGADGRASNRLELLTQVNKLDHKDAHDALSDVMATIAVARLIYNKHEKLFNYLLKLRDKHAVKELITTHETFVYTSGKYPSQYQKTTVATVLGEHPGKQGVLVYDLRTDPDNYVGMTAVELAVAWRERVKDETKRFPVKTMQFNRCPAVAPVSVLDDAAQANIKIDLDVIAANLRKLKEHPQFLPALLDAIKLMDRQQQVGLVSDELQVDAALYDGFVSDQDKTAMSVVRAAGSDEIGSLDITFRDQRLVNLLPLYKARNFTNVLSSEERAAWEQFRTRKLLDGGSSSQAQLYFSRLAELAADPALTTQQRYLLEELQLYGESILPTPDA